MSEITEALSVTLRNSKPLAPPFHRHIAKARLLDRTCRAGDRVVIYDVVATEPDGEVRVTRATRLQFQ
jgi:hypothetical protein